ncbi:phosphatidylserine decarboxylase proenzyme, mitochondrial-like [Schistocerca gregaria]|uniref:phosphatidylserine decarboxylase proenzyme, mitochondrial-like n=1 Tax=Schistocerca gregaria TaxID=7010 RepID=UPI00211F2600|nr:phosphatidylserine decarboxylase proenzyme, mitochondrial-like [Schistocerca gregaria]
MLGYSLIHTAIINSPSRRGYPQFLLRSSLSSTTITRRVYPLKTNCTFLLYRNTSIQALTIIEYNSISKAKRYVYSVVDDAAINQHSLRKTNAFRQEINPNASTATTLAHKKHNVVIPLHKYTGYKSQVRQIHHRRDLGPRTYRRKGLSLYIGKAFGMHGGFLSLSYFTPIFLLAVVSISILLVKYSVLDEELKGIIPNENQTCLLSYLPTRYVSRLWGKIAHTEIPVGLRSLIYTFYAKCFGCNLEEISTPLESYLTFNAFFTRRLDLKHRPISNEPIVSPVDGVVVHFGKIENNWIEQIKGIKYRLSSLLGTDAPKIIRQMGNFDSVDLRSMPKDNSSIQYALPNNLFYLVIYLAPGDYHGVHSPTDWTIKHVRHIPGHLLSVSAWSTNLVRGLLSINERLIINGTWTHGFFSMVLVGALNVGSISLEFDPNISTNLVHQNANSLLTDFVYSKFSKKGELASFFNMGSTVVLVFEAPDSWKWNINANDRIKLGQAIGSLDDSNASPLKQLA